MSMRAISILSEDGRLLADRAWAATAWTERARGWVGKPSVEAGEGLLLNPASSIHSFGMRFSFDLAFLDSRGRVLKLRPAMRPGRVAMAPLGAWMKDRGIQALELPPGSLASWGLRVGQGLSFPDRA
jgi:uncharacterized membrane protein (UPF0127 family)